MVSCRRRRHMSTTRPITSALTCSARSSGRLSRCRCAMGDSAWVNSSASCWSNSKARASARSRSPPARRYTQRPHAQEVPHESDPNPRARRSRRHEARGRPRAPAQTGRGGRQDRGGRGELHRRLSAQRPLQARDAAHARPRSGRHRDGRGSRRHRGESRRQGRLHGRARRVRAVRGGAGGAARGAAAGRVDQAGRGHHAAGHDRALSRVLDLSAEEGRHVPRARGGRRRRPHRHDRSADPQRQGLALPHAPEPVPLHRHARGAAAARRRAVRLGPRGQAEAAHGIRVPAQGRRGGAPRARGPQDDGQGAAHSVNVAQLLERSALYHGARTALVAGDRRWTYRELDAAVSALAGGFAGLGLSSGERLGLHLPNWPEFALAYYAAQKCGLGPLSPNVTYKAEEIEYIVGDAKPTAVITADPVAGSLPSRDRMPSVRHLLNGKDLGSLRGAPRRARDLEREETAAILYTSATTGRPKGVMLTHANVISNAYATVHHLKMSPDDRGLCALPMFHCFGQNAIMNSLLAAGGTMVMHERFVPDTFVDAIAAQRITIFYAVPTMYILFLAMERPLDFASVRLYFSAAATLPTDVERRWHARFGHWIQQGYGLTETSPFASYNHDVAFKPGSVGTPIENVEMKIVDADDREVADGERGEIVIKGPNVMKGYFGNDAATAEAIREGWFHSGDIGYRDADGYFFIVDRVKDMINVSGFKVFPREVEEVLFRHAAVKEAAVIGIPDPVRGEAVKAFVVLAEGARASAEELQALCRVAVADYKVPGRIEFVPALPKNPTGKILKKDLRTRGERVE